VPKARVGAACRVPRLLLAGARRLDDPEREPLPVDLHHTSALALTGAGGGGDALANLLPFLLLAVAFWFLLIRPQRKRAQEAAQIRSNLQVGVEVMTTAGLYGTVAHVDDEAVLLEVAPGVTNRYAKGAVARILTAPDPAGESPASERVDDLGHDALRDETVRDDTLGDDAVRDDRPGRDEGPAAGR
jgi:preprotein translocase subunit YajC